jgi:hypothetical protein
MKDSELTFDRSCHVLYSPECRRKILDRIAAHYPEERREDVFSSVQRQFVDYLMDYRTDLGGRKNFHNGLCGTYDCIAVFSYYVVCREVTSFEEIERMYGELFLASFKKLGFVDCNRKIFRKLMYLSFRLAERRCRKWKDYDMRVEPYSGEGPIRYKFHSCPVAEFARNHGLLDILPALCNADYAGMECLHARLVRTTTLSSGPYCDYAICGDRDPWIKGHEEYRDTDGARRNIDATTQTQPVSPMPDGE